MSVHCDNEDWVKRAKNLVRQTGGEEIGAVGESGGDFSVSDRPLPRMRRAGQDPFLPVDETAAEEETETSHRPETVHRP
jgi:hypothetical protein